VVRSFWQKLQVGFPSVDHVAEGGADDGDSVNLQDLFKDIGNLVVVCVDVPHFDVTR
jgi:hypothetical protein